MEENIPKFDNFEWRGYHTFSMLICCIIYTLLLRSVIVFNYALSEELGVTITMFSPVVVTVYVALIISPFVANLNNKCTLNSSLIFKIYSIVAGIFGMLFGLPFAISQFTAMPNYSLIVFLTIIWLFFSTTQNIAKFESYTLASQYNKDTSSHGKIRSILSGGSWSITSLFYIVQGYCIEYQSSMIFFGLGIMICIFPLFTMVLLPKYNDYTNYIHNQGNNNGNSNSNSNINSNNNNLRLLLHYNWLKDNFECCLIFIILILIGISSGSADVIFNPLFMNVYNMSTSESGICTLTIAFGEISAALFLANYSGIDYFKLVALSIIFKLSCAIGFILLIFLTDINDGLTSNTINYTASVALSLIFFQLWFFGWTLFYVIQLIHVYKFVSTKENTSITEFLLTINCCCAIGRSIGAICTPVLWEYYDNKSIALLIIALIWFVTITMGIILYLKLYDMIHSDQTKQVDDMTISDHQTQESEFLIERRHDD